LPRLCHAGETPARFAFFAPSALLIDARALLACGVCHRPHCRHLLFLPFPPTTTFPTAHAPPYLLTPAPLFHHLTPTIGRSSATWTPRTGLWLGRFYSVLALPTTRGTAPHTPSTTPRRTHCTPTCPPSRSAFCVCTYAAFRCDRRAATTPDLNACSLAVDMPRPRRDGGRTQLWWDGTATRTPISLPTRLSIAVRNNVFSISTYTGSGGGVVYLFCDAVETFRHY